MKKIFQFIYGMRLEDIIIVMLLISIIWLLGKRMANAKNIWKVWNIFIAIGTILAILVVTLSFRYSEDTELILVPFDFLVRAQTQPEIYRSMFMNIFLFFPLGLTLPYTLSQKWKRNVLLTILFALTLSVTIEFLQYYYHLGRAEIDDVICNTLGAAIGTLSYTLERKFFNK